MSVLTSVDSCEWLSTQAVAAVDRVENVLRSQLDRNISIVRRVLAQCKCSSRFIQITHLPLFIKFPFHTMQGIFVPSLLRAFNISLGHANWWNHLGTSSSFQVTLVYLRELIMWGNFTLNKSKGSDYWMLLVFTQLCLLLFWLKQVNKVSIIDIKINFEQNIRSLWK